jgi:hypothetical protein
MYTRSTRIKKGLTLVNKPNSNGRKTDGKFAAGNKLGGRTKGSRHKATMAVEELLDGQVEQLTQKAVDAALGGDMTAMRLCLERICPPRKDRPVPMELPEMTNAEGASCVMAGILGAVAEGEITPDEASRVTSIVEVYRKTLETSELETRLQSLEQAKG